MTDQDNPMADFLTIKVNKKAYEQLVAERDRYKAFCEEFAYCESGEGHSYAEQIRSAAHERGMRDAAEAINRLREALAGLVAAKDEKDSHGDTPVYRALKAGKWEEARAILSAIPKQEK